jgi:hypothetical protein
MDDKEKLELYRELDTLKNQERNISDKTYARKIVVWQMNPIRTITKEYVTEKFTVLKK